LITESSPSLLPHKLMTAASLDPWAAPGYRALRIAPIAS
jgi:hypothetical protein